MNEAHVFKSKECLNTRKRLILKVFDGQIDVFMELIFLLDTPVFIYYNVCAYVV